MNKLPEKQLVLKGAIRENSGGGECIHFHVNLAFFTLKCIVNVPADGMKEAPVYVKFRLRTEKDENEESPQVVRRRN